LISPAILPYGICRQNENLILATHPCAGHIGFFTGLNPKQWFMGPVLDYFQALELKSNQ